MFGIGIGEILIVLLIAVVVFGGPVVIAFFVGYQAGRKKAVHDVTAPPATTPVQASPAAAPTPPVAAPQPEPRTEENPDE